jgi:hydroxyacylglutathione hydrolase
MRMALIIHQFPCLSDNYGFLVRDAASGQVACVDTPDAESILREAANLQWPIDLILNTHWHPDHAGGNAAVKAATGALIVAPAEVEKSSAIDRVVCGGEYVALGETSFEVLPAAGHTLGHVVYHAADPAVLFAGDTLFPMGCGRLFEGTARQMWASLSRLAALPESTVIYSAHEYTLANAPFAVSVDPDPAVARRAEEVATARARGEPTVPTTVARELATNPFLRAPALLGDAGRKNPIEAFAKLRAAKDAFAG